MPTSASHEETFSPTSAQLASTEAVMNQAKTEAAVTAIVGSDAHFLSQGRPGAVAAAALPTQLGPWNTNYISFNNGVPVGSPNCALTLHQNGAYTFQGHFHDSGATSYNGEITWMVATGKGAAFSFAQHGHMAGTFESGSRDWNFNVNGTNPAIAAHWADLCAAYHWQWKAAVNLDLGALFTSVEQALSQAVGVALQVIAVVS